MTFPAPKPPYYFRFAGIRCVAGGTEDGPVGSLEHKYFIEGCLMRGKLAEKTMEQELAESATRIIYKGTKQ